LYVQQQAWLGLRPQEKGPTNAETYGELLPEVKDRRYWYLVVFLYELGAHNSSGLNASPILFSEIKAWSDLMQMELQPWEVEVIRSLSVAHCEISNDPAAPPPTDDDSIKEEIEDANMMAWKLAARGG